MGVASLGYTNGPGFNFRIDPTEIQVNYDIHTAVHDTVGGRVIQVTGATLSDITIQGSLGEDRTKGGGTTLDHPGVGWRLAQQFFVTIQKMVQFQSANVDKPHTAIPSAMFTYPPLNMRLPVYIKSCVDPENPNAMITNKVGKANYQYVLTLMPAQNVGTTLIQAGQNGSAFDKAAAQAIDAYINRITQTNGIGWQVTVYNGGNLSTGNGTPTGKPGTATNNRTPSNQGGQKSQTGTPIATGIQVPGGVTLK